MDKPASSCLNIATGAIKLEGVKEVAAVADKVGKNEVSERAGMWSTITTAVTSGWHETLRLVVILAVPGGLGMVGAWLRLH